MDPRDTARRWLAETMDRARGSDEIAPSMFLNLADAILNEPGVEVGSILRPLDGTRRTAIMLPIGDGDG